MNKSIRTQLDACRPGKADMLNAEMDALRAWIELSDDNKEIAETAEAFDQSIVDAMTDIPVDVDSGLMQKLNANLKSALAGEVDSDLQSKSEMMAAELDADGRLTNREFLKDIFVAETDLDLLDSDSPLSAEVTADSDSKTSRHVMLKVILSTAAAIMVLVGFYASGIFHSKQLIVVGHNELALEAGDWQPQMAPGRWDTKFERLPDNYPLSDKLNVNPRQWKRITTKYDSTAVVVDLVPSDAEPAFLYVLQADHDFEMRLPEQFVMNQVYPANGCWVGAYQQGAVTYVLVVKGDKDRFRQIVKAMKEIV